MESERIVIPFENNILLLFIFSFFGKYTQRKKRKLISLAIPYITRVKTRISDCEISIIIYIIYVYKYIYKGRDE